jgi:hypothetical protein
MLDLFYILYELNYGGMKGLLRAKRDGIITSEEYYSLKEYAHDYLHVPRDWYRTMVWDCCF